MQIFTENDITEMVYLIAELTENYPERLNGFKPETIAVAYKAQAAAPLTTDGYRDISVRLNLQNARRGW